MIKDGGSGRPEETGAYTKSTNPQRAVYAVAGSSGQSSGGALNHPVMYVSPNNLGSMVLDVDGSRLDAKFLRENGAIADSFTILRTAGNTPPTVGIIAPANHATFVAPATIAIAASADDPGGRIAKVERSTDGRKFTPIAVVGANATTYASTGLGANKTYYCRIGATDGSGDSTCSNTATAKTPRR